MDIVSHIVFAHILSGQQDLSLPLILGAAVPDIDRLYMYLKGKFRGASSRTFIQELPFLSLLILIGIVIDQPLFSLGVISHIFLDFVTGETKPFYPFCRETVNFNLPIKYKIVLGGIIWGIGAVYMAGLTF